MDEITQILGKGIFTIGGKSYECELDLSKLDEHVYTQQEVDVLRDGLYQEFSETVEALKYHMVDAIDKFLKTQTPESVQHMTPAQIYNEAIHSEDANDLWDVVNGNDVDIEVS